MKHAGISPSWQERLGKLAGCCLLPRPACRRCVHVGWMRAPPTVGDPDGHTPIRMGWSDTPSWQLQASLHRAHFVGDCTVRTRSHHTHIPTDNAAPHQLACLFRSCTHEIREQPPCQPRCRFPAADFGRTERVGLVGHSRNPRITRCSKTLWETGKLRHKQWPGEHSMELLTLRSLTYKPTTGEVSIGMHHPLPRHERRQWDHCLSSRNPFAGTEPPHATDTRHRHFPPNCHRRLDCH